MLSIEICDLASLADQLVREIELDEAALDAARDDSEREAIWRAQQDRRAELRLVERDLAALGSAWCPAALDRAAPEGPARPADAGGEERDDGQILSVQSRVYI